MKMFGTIVISVLGTILFLYFLKDRKESENYKLLDKVVRLIKTDEFKILSKNKELKDLLRTPEFIDLSFTFGRDLVLEQLGIISKK